MVQLEKYGVLSPVELYEDASAKLTGDVTGESPFITRALETSPKHEVPPPFSVTEMPSMPMHVI